MVTFRCIAKQSRAGQRSNTQCCNNKELIHLLYQQLLRLPNALFDKRVIPWNCQEPFLPGRSTSNSCSLDTFSVSLTLDNCTWTGVLFIPTLVIGIDVSEPESTSSSSLSHRKLSIQPVVISPTLVIVVCANLRSVGRVVSLWVSRWIWINDVTTTGTLHTIRETQSSIIAATTSLPPLENNGLSEMKQWAKATTYAWIKMKAAWTTETAVVIRQVEKITVNRRRSFLSLRFRRSLRGA